MDVFDQCAVVFASRLCDARFTCCFTYSSGHRETRHPRPISPIKPHQLNPVEAIAASYRLFQEETPMSSQNDERPNARAREQRLGLAKRPRFEDYREKYAKHFKMERRDGILQVQMHTEGGPVIFNLHI